MTDIKQFHNIQFVLMDIEGTTTSISFVHEVLFPYSYEKMDQYVQNYPEKVQGLKDPKPSEVLKAWIKEDKKDPLLKSIQGDIWQKGYLDGSIKGHIYKDVPGCLKSWKENEIQLGIYSSGSVKAQKLLFSYSDFGDLTSYFSHYFDTLVGHKRESNSYQNISKKVDVLPENILFLSDIFEELDAAKSIGFQTCQLVRNEDVVTSKNHLTVASFLEIQVN